jgi:hypothetical protein
MSASSSLIEDRRKVLQQYLQELALIPAIKESPYLKAFLGIQNHFPEFCEDILNNQIESMTKANPQQKQSFKIMSDLFDKPKQQLNSKAAFEIEDLINSNSQS